MIGYRIRRFLDAWASEDGTTKVFLAWNATNTVLAFALLVGSVFLVSVMSRPGFQRTVLVGYIVVAVAWLLSIFVIGPVYDRVVPPEGEEEEKADG